MMNIIVSCPAFANNDIAYLYFFINCSRNSSKDYAFKRINRRLLRFWIFSPYASISFSLLAFALFIDAFAYYTICSPITTYNHKFPIPSSILHERTSLAFEFNLSKPKEYPGKIEPSSRVKSNFLKDSIFEKKEGGSLLFFRDSCASLFNFRYLIAQERNQVKNYLIVSMTSPHSSITSPK